MRIHALFLECESKTLRYKLAESCTCGFTSSKTSVRIRHGGQPGPFQTYLISQTLTRGWKQTLAAAFAPLISDRPIITLCLLVLSQFPFWFQRFLYIAGGLFILYLAYGAYSSWKNFRALIGVSAAALLCFGVYQLWLGLK